MRFAILGSGSEGNGLIVEKGSTRILVDSGFSLRSCEERLRRLDVSPETLTAILVTHEHEDHIRSVASLSRRYQIPVWLTFGTLVAARDFTGVLAKNFDSHETFAIGDCEIQPFSVPHDAREPVQFVIGDGRYRLGLATDLGCLTPYVEAALSGCDALILECNHDRNLLSQSNYPPSLKQRIAGRWGHLDNDTAVDLLRRIDTSRLQHLVAAHLSQQNNHPRCVQEALAEVLHAGIEDIAIADQETGLPWRQLT